MDPVCPVNLIALHAQEPKQCKPGLALLAAPLMHAITSKISYMHATAKHAKLEFVASDAPLQCQELLLNNFRDGKVFQQCCPTASLSCAGCVEYDPASDSCNECATGFSPFVHPGTNQTTCQLCENLPFSAPQTCHQYETIGVCRKGQMLLSVGNGSNDSSSSDSDSMLRTYSGMAANEACCACGGGRRGTVPFMYPAVHVPTGKTAVSVQPVPRLDALYLTESCRVHTLNLTMNSTTGRVYGDLVSPEPQELTCTVRSKGFGQLLTEDPQAALQIHVEHFSYSHGALVFTQNRQSFTPSFHGRFNGFQLRCTPDLPWAQIDLDTGRITKMPQATPHCHAQAAALSHDAFIHTSFGCMATLILEFYCQFRSGHSVSLPGGGDFGVHAGEAVHRRGPGGGQ